MHTTSFALIGAAYATGFCVWGLASGTAVLLLRKWDKGLVSRPCRNGSIGRQRRAAPIPGPASAR